MGQKQFTPGTRSEDTGVNLSLDKGKDTGKFSNFYHYHQQKLQILEFFSNTTTTMYEAERVTGVCRPNICRIVRQLEKQDRIHRVKQGLCPISGFRAWYFSIKEGGQDE